MKEKGRLIVMNINPEKVKELILIYSELNEDYQKELMKQVYMLRLKQTQSNKIQEEGIRFKTDIELQDEINKRSTKTAKDAMEVLNALKKMNDTDKATIFMLVNQLEGKGSTVKESDITITVNQKEVSMRDYLEKQLFDVDYDKAKEKVSKFMNESQGSSINE